MLWCAPVICRAFRSAGAINGGWNGSSWRNTFRRRIGAPQSTCRSYRRRRLAELWVVPVDVVGWGVDGVESVVGLTHRQPRMTASGCGRLNEIRRFARLMASYSRYPAGVVALSGATEGQNIVKLAQGADILVHGVADLDNYRERGLWMRSSTIWPKPLPTRRRWQVTTGRCRATGDEPSRRSWHGH